MEHKLNAVICVLNSKYIHSSLSPWCLKAGVREYCDEGIKAEIVEGTINESPERVLERILQHKPEVIAFSCYIWNKNETKLLLKSVKRELPDTLIILGGPEVSYNAADVLRDEAMVDYVVSGEGEKPFPLLLNAIFRGEKAEGIPGLSYRSAGRIISAEPYTSGEEPPSPYSEEYFAALGGRIAYLETSRGCPYSCAFCLSGYGNVRYFGIERAKRELLLLAKSGAKTIKLVDRTFNANRRRAAELFGFIISNYSSAIPKEVCFHFEIAGDILDDETISLLNSAPPGLIQLEIGIQSFNPKTLEAINRRTDIKRLKRNIEKLCLKGNIHVHIDLIAGLPYEDLRSFADGFNLAYCLKPNMLQLGFLKLLYGSPMQKDAERYKGKYKSGAPYEVLETPWLSSFELKSLHDTEDALERLYNSGRFRRTLEYLLNVTGAMPFELLSDFGEGFGKEVKDGISLEGFISFVFDFFCRKDEIDKTVLRDIMVCDFLATNSSCRLPKALRIEDPELKHIKARIGRNVGRRAAAILYSEGCAVYADYIEKDPVKGEYPISKIVL